MMGKEGKNGIEKTVATRRDKSQTKELLDKKDEEAGQVNGTVKETAAFEEHFTPPDGGWGWVVCFASLWANGTVFGVINTFGIIYVHMRDHYAKDNEEVSLKTAFVGSACTGVTFLLCTVSSILSDRVGIRPTAFVGAIIATAGLAASAFVERMEILYLTFGVLLGVGSSMVYSPSLVILGHYFKNHIGLVNGIVSFGSSIFTIALTRILPSLLSSIGIQYTFLFLGGLHVVMIFLSLTWRPVFKKEEHLASMALSTESVYQHCENCCSWTKRFLNVKIWRNKGYVVWVMSLGVALFGYFVPFFHLPKHTQDNFPDSDGSDLILCLSITSGISRIIFGKLADFPWMNRIRMQQMAFLVLGITTACIPFSPSFEGLIVISLFMGVCDGIFVCLLGPIAFDLVGPLHASQAIGFLLGVFSVPFTIGPPVAGWLYDYTGNYTIAFHAAGAPPILGAILMFFIPKVNQNYPAVNETQTFASISMLDVFSEVKGVGSQSGQNHGAGNQSGPMSELEMIESSDLLYLGKGKQADKEPMLSVEEADDSDETNGGPGTSRSTQPSSQGQGKSTPTEDKDEPDTYPQHGGKDEEAEREDTGPDSSYDNDNMAITDSNKDGKEANVEPMSTSLLDEVSKYLETVAMK